MLKTVLTLTLTMMTQTLAISVLQIFSVRLHVGHCRSGCLAGWRTTSGIGEKAIMSGQEQCWDVCGMLGSDTPTWAEVCNREVCVGPCQIAFKMFFSTRTKIGQNKQNLFIEAAMMINCTVVWDRICCSWLWPMMGLKLARPLEPVLNLQRVWKC